MADEGGIDTILEWPTLSEETQLLSDEMRSFLRSNPVAYAGHRIIANFVQVSDYDETTEHNEVPFLNWWFFSIALTGYWLLRRFLHVLGRNTTPSGFNGHIFVMNSDRHDKRYTLTAVSERLRDQDYDVLLLCSPEAQSYRERWEDRGLSTTSFVELLGAIPLRRWLSLFGTTIRLIRGLRGRDPDSFAAASKTLVFNFVFLEAVKSESLLQTTNQPTIHTYAPMGYVLDVTDFDRVFSYQHGIMYGQESETGNQEYRRGYPFFAPINYLTWGEPWHNKFQYSTPPDTELHPTGTPWHEFLNQYKTDSDREHDVVFLSSAGRQTVEGEEAFERFVRRLIDVCEQRNWQLGIKLHPKETGDWYAERGWAEYVLSSDSAIQDVLSNSRVAITTGSSTLVESMLLGTPICKWFDQKSPIERKEDLELVFDIRPETIESTIEDALETAASDPDVASVLNYKGVTDQIMEIVTRTDGEKPDG
ncbi:hypothetical protein EXE51_00690 [Halorubrum sp. CGM5_25_10-8B]|uniref:hypothetical protein n=1 Tax=Halorubrum sp. CGM5_25_10-8B TaxID=2518115 RepID=UPI0010F43780|nr:hypothetical protein [Halorubrum sp. CGM5_25_10-8B]TKX39428.1 hypothetical protein EXE51_00690 [Halorubrum sp. CGM5_25_10-8B]